MNKRKRLYLTAIFLLIFHSTAYAETLVDMRRIIAIESSGNPRAFNSKSQARGLCQITEICLKEWNNFNPTEKYTLQDLYNPETNKKIASWYLEIRIPKMLKHYGIPLTVENILIAYNAGISYLVDKKSIPDETAGYIRKYKEGR